MSVEDKQAAGTLSQASNGFQQDAAAAVAQMLGPGTSALVEISVKCKGLPDRDVLRWVTDGRCRPTLRRWKAGAPVVFSVQAVPHHPTLACMQQERCNGGAAGGRWIQCQGVERGRQDGHSLQLPECVEQKRAGHGERE